jgi:hypothetical protein
MRLGKGYPEIWLFKKGTAMRALCRFAINKKLRVMPTVVDCEREQDRNEQVRAYDHVTERSNTA